jgi:FkbM family methyltransferase
MTFGARIARILRRLGWDVVPLDHRVHPLARRARLLASHGIDLVLDVGANEGQYARELRAIGYRGRIVSFEPLSAPFGRLEAALGNDAGWRGRQVAVGPQIGRATIHVAANSWSSSLLPMLPAHERLAPGSGYVGEEEVAITTLEALVREHARDEERLFVKVDTQGYERRVLESAGPALSRITGLQLELSIVPLYEGEELLSSMLRWLEERGFILMSLEPGHADPATGQLLQVDGVFFRSRP